MNAAAVIPAYNEAATIASVVRSVSHVGTVIVVDDGSEDGTGDLAAAEGAVVVRHSVNRGYDGALQSGFEKAAELEVEIVVTFDADGQHEAGILDRFMAPISTGEVDLVLGIRPKPVRVSEFLFNQYGRLRFGVKDLLCGLKGYRMSIYHQHGRFDGTRSIGTELALAGLRRRVPMTTVPVPIHPREGTPRLGSLFQANGRILRALAIALWTDLRDKSA